LEGYFDIDAETRLYFNHRPARSRAVTFVFINSSGATASAWDSVITPRIHAQGFGTLTIDLRGQGRSGVGPQSTLETAEMVADVCAILDHLAIRRIIIVGLSIGGLRAANLWRVRHGVEGLVLINCLRRKGPLTEWVSELETRLMAIGGTQLVHDAFRPVTVGQSELARIRPNHLPSDGYQPMDRTHPRYRLAEGAKHADWDFPWHEIDVPVLVLTGMHDRLFRVQEDVDTIVRSMQHAIEIRFPDEGHALHTENPGRTADELMRFAGEIRTAAPRTLRSVADIAAD
jgi:3-oxoadipate enol-lactonase